ncbi:unnamed protein product [[Candida] boidinii]|nr:unnamed protein product [[Candida] boidinii]
MRRFSKSKVADKKNNFGLETGPSNKLTFMIGESISLCNFSVRFEVPRLKIVFISIEVSVRFHEDSEANAGEL